MLRVVRYIAVESVVGAVIDHILVGRGDAATEVHDEGLLAATLNETDTYYELVHVSADRGLMEVHRRVGSP